MTMAWSTPGAALLAGSAVPALGFGAAVTAFAISGVLIALCGLVRPLGAAVSAIPPALANAMLAGVLLTLCVEPFRALSLSPAAIAPVLVTWLVLMRVARRWAVPGALAAAVVVIAVSGSFSHLAGARLTPVLVGVAPAWEPAAVVAIALPLFLVTMTSQNIPGMAVLASFGYRPPLAPPLLYTGAASVVGAFGGAHAINLAAISAALAAGPAAHPDRSRRWVAGRDLRDRLPGSGSGIGAGRRRRPGGAGRDHGRDRRPGPDRHVRLRGRLGAGRRRAPGGRGRHLPGRRLRAWHSVASGLRSGACLPARRTWP